MKLIEAAPSPETPNEPRRYRMVEVVISGANDPALNGTWRLINGIPVEKLD